MEFVPEDPREGAGPVGVTGCIGINSYETAVVGLTNSYWAWPPVVGMWEPVSNRKPSVDRDMLLESQPSSSIDSYLDLEP